MDFVELKKRDIHRARNYKYKHGEISEIADLRFERALRARDLSEFPNVTYHLEMKMIVKRDKQDSLDQIASQLADYEKSMDDDHNSSLQYVDNDLEK